MFNFFIAAKTEPDEPPANIPSLMTNSLQASLDSKSLIWMTSLKVFISNNSGIRLAPIPGSSLGPGGVPKRTEPTASTPTTCILGCISRRRFAQPFTVPVVLTAATRQSICPSYCSIISTAPF